MNLNYYNRRGKELERQIAEMKEFAQTLPEAKTVEEVMGIFVEFIILLLISYLMISSLAVARSNLQRMK